MVNIMDVGGVNLFLFEIEDYGILRIELDILDNEIVIVDRLMFNWLGKLNDEYMRDMEMLEY